MRASQEQTATRGVRVKNNTKCVDLHSPHRRKTRRCILPQVMMKSRSRTRHVCIEEVNNLSKKRRLVTCHDDRIGVKVWS